MRRYPALTKRHTAVYIGPYPPTSTPAALFTMDLLSATDLFGWQSVVIAVEGESIRRDEWDDKKVIGTLDPYDPATYAPAAEIIVQSGASLVCILYTPDLYGPACAGNLGVLAKMIDCPLVLILHAIDPNPDESTQLCIAEIEPRCSAFVTLAHLGLKTLAKAYRVPRNKVRFIPHGAPYISCEHEDEQRGKTNLGLQDRIVLCSLGPISPQSGIEITLNSLPALLSEYPQLLYVVLGQADRSESEYRAELEDMIRRLELADHVQFLDRRLDLPQLIEHLIVSDIYISAERPEPHQIMSDNLAYAFAAGRLIVSTPSPYARELLANRRGYLVPFDDQDAIARRIKSILDDPVETRTVRQRVFAFSRGMSWEDIGMKYVELYEEILQHLPAETVMHDSLRSERGVPSTLLRENARLDPWNKARD